MNSTIITALCTRLTAYVAEIESEHTKTKRALHSKDATIAAKDSTIAAKDAIIAAIARQRNEAFRHRDAAEARHKFAVGKWREHELAREPMFGRDSFESMLTRVQVKAGLTSGPPPIPQQEFYCVIGGSAHQRTFLPSFDRALAHASRIFGKTPSGKLLIVKVEKIVEPDMPSVVVRDVRAADFPNPPRC